MTELKKRRKHLKKQIALFAVSISTTIILGALFFDIRASAAPGISIDLNTAESSGGAMGALDILFMLVIIALIPSILIMMTSFTRIVIVLSFLRNALGTQQSPPNQIIIGLSLVLTLFIMTPTIDEINTSAYIPFREGQITQDEAIKKAAVPMKTFMLKQVQKKDLDLFISISKKPIADISIDNTEKLNELGLEIILPAFITSELKRAFTMGFLLFVPFLIIDLVTSSILMSMGMVMLPPGMIALPFKIMMFVLVDGWGLLIGTLAKSFR